MTLKNRKKNTRQRAGTTHGWGSMKKHRGAGHRGGRGNAGSGKRGDAKKPSYWKDKKRYGKHGFTSKKPLLGATINVGHLNSGLSRLVADNLVTKKGDSFIIDLSALGIDRLLGGGIVTEKMEITVLTATPRAVERVQKAGGKITITGRTQGSVKDSE